MAIVRLRTSLLLCLTVAKGEVLGCNDAHQVDLDFTSVSSSNLAGKGPELQMPQNIRYLYTCSVDAVAIDTVLEADSSYEPADPKQNGQQGRFARINLKAGTKANFTLSFRQSGTAQKLALRTLFLKFFFMDSTGDSPAAHGSAKVTVRGYASHSPPPAEVQNKVQEQGGLFTEELSPKRELATTFTFQDQPVISFVLEAGHAERNFFFLGSTCDVPPRKVVAASTTYEPPRPSPPEVLQDEFDCQAGLWNCIKGWTQMKKDWCINQMDVDCQAEQSKALAHLTMLHSPGQASSSLASTTLAATSTTASTTNPAGMDWEACTARPVSSCHGEEVESKACEDLPTCLSVCEPQDCEFADWEDWSSLGGCTGLCQRHRRIRRLNNACGKPCEGAKIETDNLPFCLPEVCVQKSVDCKWEDWSSWTSCTYPTAQQSRARKVKEQPLGSGKVCEGPRNQTRACAGPVAKPCVLSDWGEWTDCSATCGGGWKAQMRRVVRYSQNGGQPCEGSVRQDIMCGTAPCGKKVDCRLGDWSEWTGCGGKAARQKYRERPVLEPAQAGGKPCGEHLEETEGCEVHKVGECQLSDWSSWSSCPVTCGGGQKERTRVLNDDACKLDPLEHELSLKEAAPCHTDECPPAPGKDNCDFTSWSDWEECSATCGAGHTVRKRVLQVAAPGGKACAGALEEITNCTAAAKCSSKDCEWGDWHQWSTCSKTCGGGVKQRSRGVKTAPKDGGKPCAVHEKAEIQPCGTQNCTACVNGSWSEWTEWSRCSATCGPGYRSRHRDIAQHANKCGVPATGPMQEHRSCEGQPACGTVEDCKLSEWGQWSTCSSRCYGVRERDREIKNFASNGGKPCVDEQTKEIAPCNPEPGHEPPYGCEDQEEERPEACQLGAWSVWSECSKTCGGGQHTRARHVLSPSSHNGDPCTAVLFEVSPCGKPVCGEPCQDCKWGKWSEWGECTHCNGMTYRHREIDKMPNHCGKPCEAGDAKEMTPCSRKCVSDHSLFCVWGDWSGESPCSANCGPATKTKSRRLFASEVAPSDLKSILFKGPKDGSCSAAQIDVATCNNPSCSPTCQPVNCTFGQWSDWEDATCSRQLCERRRRVERQDSCGGKGCDGGTIEVKDCPLECDKPTDCQLSTWTTWTGTCERKEDQMTRGRTVVQRGEYGGKPCAGHLIETKPCHIEAQPSCSPVDCEVGLWSAWSSCTKSCGGEGGLRLRRRMIAKEAACGGSPCTSSMAVLESCGNDPCEGKIKDCEMSEWTEWSECDNRFERMRHRQVLHEADSAGQKCSSSTKEVQQCKQSVDCVVSDWIEWDGCDKTCGGGQQQRQRMVTRMPMGHGAACPRGLVETEGCNRIPCEDQDCEVGAWGEWTPCSSSCGAGQRSRARSLKQLAQDDGVGCSLALSETEGCEERQCSHSTVQNCKWGEWSSWSTCSRDCGGGQRTRERKVEQYPKNGGMMCDSRTSEEVIPCNVDACAEKECKDGRWGTWSEWEVCSMTCKGGITWRHRRVEREANHCGEPAQGPSRETAACSQHTPCEVDADCAFGSWEPWTVCTRTCDGVQRRLRKVHAGSGNGMTCAGPVAEDRPCNDRHEGCLHPGEKGDCGLGDWSDWDKCPVTCGGAQTERRREFHGGAQARGPECEANIAETQPCGRHSCAESCTLVDCRWSDWGDWGECDKCGGQRTRSRHVEHHPQCGGLQCEPGAAEEVSNCTRMCHGSLHYCAWEDWGSWGTCSSSCGQGLKRRSRKMAVSDDPPKHCQSEEVRMRFLPDIPSEELGNHLALQQKFEQLHQRAVGLEGRRRMDLVYAYILGSAGLLLLFAALRPRKLRLLQEEDPTLA